MAEHPLIGKILYRTGNPSEGVDFWTTSEDYARTLNPALVMHEALLLPGATGKAFAPASQAELAARWAKIAPNFIELLSKPSAVLTAKLGLDQGLPYVEGETYAQAEAKAQQAYQAEISQRAQENWERNEQRRRKWKQQQASREQAASAKTDIDQARQRQAQAKQHGVKIYTSRPEREREEAPWSYTPESLEKATLAAIRLPTGKVYTGSTHANAYAKMRKAKVNANSFEEGFMTNTGRYVSREEAYGLALKSKQMTDQGYRQASTDLWGQPDTSKELGALSFGLAKKLKAESAEALVDRLLESDKELVRV